MSKRIMCPSCCKQSARVTGPLLRCECGLVAREIFDFTTDANPDDTWFKLFVTDQTFKVMHHGKDSLESVKRYNLR